MSNWQDKSDFEINKAVTMMLGQFKESEYSKVSGNFHRGRPSYSGYKVGVVFDYCNNSSDAWPIIIENSISLIKTDDDKWIATLWLSDDVESWDKNPLRAAMIVYLEMNNA